MITKKILDILYGSSAEEVSFETLADLVHDDIPDATLVEIFVAIKNEHLVEMDSNLVVRRQYGGC